VAAARRRAPAAAYVPVDVSAAALVTAAGQLRTVVPDLEVRPLHADYVQGLACAARLADPAPLLALLLGSNVGNLEWPAAVALLRSLRRALRSGDHLLVGFDLLKSEELLRNAYDDPEGVTAAFNLNLLSRMNRELGSDFDLPGFEHRATFDAGRPAMESWLVSRRAQVVRVSGERFAFREGEPLRTEVSWKYTEPQLTALARAAGFREVARLHDERRWFADVLYRVGPEAA
jgi:dimethylhistidine N-methyltransferase